MTTPDLRNALRAEAIKAADLFYETAMQLVATRISSALGAGAPALVPQAPVEAPVQKTRPLEQPQKKERERLTQEVLEEVLAQIVGLLEQHPKGLRSEQIRTELGVDKKLFQYAAHLGKQSDQIVQTGERRATTYSLPARPSRAQEEGRVTKRRRRS